MIDYRIEKACTRVSFGEMRIRLAPGMQTREDGVSKSGVLALQYHETTEQCLQAIADKTHPDADVLLVFDTVESIDKVIRALMEVRFFMTKTQEASDNA